MHVTRALALYGLGLGAACSTAITPDETAPDASVSTSLSVDLAYSCPGPLPDHGDLPCDVAAVLASKCQTCHQRPPVNHAPWPLVTYEDSVAPFGITALVRWQRMAVVIEPPNQPRMPPAGRPQLTDGERAILRAWFQRCAAPAAEGEGCDREDGGAFRGFDFAGDGEADLAPGADGGR